jgi:hypothetical protein
VELLGLVEQLVLEVERLVRAELDLGGLGGKRSGGDVAGRHIVLCCVTKREVWGGRVERGVKAWSFRRWDVVS